MNSLATLLLALAPQAGLTVDDFDSGTNPNGWTFGVQTPDVIQTSGGNPAGWLRNPLVDSFAPIVTIQPSGPTDFVGDLRAKQVVRMGLDAITNQVATTAADRSLTILLRDTKGTPTLTDDDWAYSTGPLVPQPGAGWRTYSFDVPSQSTDPVPSGWKGGSVLDPERFRPGVQWSDVITSVDQVEFWWIDPTFFAIIQQWDVGIDNVFVETEGDLGVTHCLSTPNSTGERAALGAAGRVVAALNDLTLTASGLPPNSFGFFLVSDVPGFVPNPGGGSEGNLCLSGAIGRFYGPGQIQNSGPAGVFTLPVDLTRIPRPNSFAATLPGQTWYFQAWHRDTQGPRGNNLTGSLSVTFQ
ncbi:MAG: hypothetical protein ACPGPE_01185 [Planctomycetota bacterium]